MLHVHTKSINPRYRRISGTGSDPTMGSNVWVTQLLRTYNVLRELKSMCHNLIKDLA
jgi:hypothetical protein